MFNVDKKAIIYDKEELMKLIFNIDKINWNGRKGVKIGIIVKEVLQNKVFSIFLTAKLRKKEEMNESDHQGR